MIDTLLADSLQDAVIKRGGDMMEATGFYKTKCFGADGVEKWSDDIENIVTTEGKTALLERGLAGSAYTAACYMGLIASGSAPVIGDTLASHSGWVEAGSNAPLYTARLPLVWSAAAGGVKSTSSTCDFTVITTGGTAKGCMVVFDSATSVNGNTTGKLYSAGFFSGGDKVLAVGDILQVTYSTTLS